MEYRVFRSIEKDLFEKEWQNQNKGFEHRTDIYFLLFDGDYGLKLRNQKKLEIKKRERRSENGQECWRKTLKSKEKVSCKDLPSVIRVLENSNEKQLAEKLTSVEPKILCYLNKYRQRVSLAGDLSRELTGFHLEFCRAEDGKQIGNDLFFETLCLQSNDSNRIEANRLQSEREFSNEQCEPMGYPEFLLRQYQKLIK